MPTLPRVGDSVNRLQAMPTLNESLLDDKLAELEKVRTWSPRVVSKLEAFLRVDDEWALFRANPFTFASERGVAEEEAVDLFLWASKVGIFQMTWNLLCPGCGVAVQSFTTLRSVCATFHCYLCAVDIETRLDDFVHVGFTVSPKIRTIPAHDPQSLPVSDFFFQYHFSREARPTPNAPRLSELFVEQHPYVAYVEPRALHKVELDAAPGQLVIYDIITNAVFVLDVDAKQPGPNAPFRLKLTEGAGVPATFTIAPGPLEIEFENDWDQRNTIAVLFKPQTMLDEVQRMLAEGHDPMMHFDRFLSGRRLLTSNAFRQAFDTETIQGAEGLAVRDISILFTDLKESTAMYDRIGDLKAFALVNQHFDRLGRAVDRNHGAVVKTIGDAVMASFEQPVDAVRAAREMLREIEAFNEEVGEREIVLKIGVHRGASIAVTLNDRLDFFGQTVNIASRVQGLADADEIYVTDDIYRAPGVKELLSELSVTPLQVTLKGVQRQVSVFLVKTPAA